METHLVTLFIYFLNVWHFLWTKPLFYLCSSYHVIMHIILLSYSTHTHFLFFLSVLDIYMCPSHLFILFWLLSLSLCFPEKKFSSGSPKGKWVIFPCFAFLLIYFSSVTPRLPSPSFFFFLPPPLSLFSSHLQFLPFIFFSFSPSYSSPLLLCEYVWQNIQPWGYIGSFMWGPVVTLKACYVVCLFASAQLPLSVLRTLVCVWLSTRSLAGWKCWLSKNNTPAPAACNCAHVYAPAFFFFFFLFSLNTFWGRSMCKDLETVRIREAWLMAATPLPVWHYYPVVIVPPTCLFFKCSQRNMVKHGHLIQEVYWHSNAVILTQSG